MTQAGDHSSCHAERSGGSPGIFVDLRLASIVEPPRDQLTDARDHGAPIWTEPLGTRRLDATGTARRCDVPMPADSNSSARGGQARTIHVQAGAVAQAATSRSSGGG
jgi:hypothetical protein